MTQYLITGLPRSGTTWAANYFTAGRSFCFHEAILGCKGVDDLAKKMSAKNMPFVGDSDSGLEAILDEVCEAVPPGTKLVVIDRNYADVAESLARLGVYPGDYYFKIMLQRHQHAIKQADYLVSFDSLFSSATLRSLWEFLLGTEPYDEDREAMLTKTVIQPHVGRYMEGYRDNPESLQLVAGAR